MNLPEKIYTEKDVKSARTKGKVIGWLQGGGIVLGGAILWNLLGSLLGWIALAVGISAVAWVLYRLMSRGSSKEDDAGDEVEG